jgi:hypothetical protein
MSDQRLLEANELVLNPEFLHSDQSLRLERVPVGVLLAPAILRRHLEPELAPDGSHGLVRQLRKSRALARHPGPLRHHLRHGQVVGDQDSNLAERGGTVLEQCLDHNTGVGLEVPGDGQDAGRLGRQDEVTRAGLVRRHKPHRPRGHADNVGSVPAGPELGRLGPEARFVGLDPLDGPLLVVVVRDLEPAARDLVAVGQGAEDEVSEGRRRVGRVGYVLKLLDFFLAGSVAAEGWDRGPCTRLGC